MYSAVDLNKTDSRLFLALDELHKILNEGLEPPCSICGKLILKLNQHFQKTHGHGLEPPENQDITESESIQFVSKRNLRTRKQNVNYSECENVQKKPNAIQKSKAKLKIPILPCTSVTIGDMSNPDIKIEDLDMDIISMDLETDFHDYPEFGGSDAEETKIDINYITGSDSVITTAVLDNTVISSSLTESIQPDGGSSNVKRSHEKKPTKDRPCKICDKKFVGAKGLALHFQKCHPEKEKLIFNCTFCEKTFTSEYSFKSHTRIHTREKPFRCDLCPKRFSEKPLLKRHKRVHAKPLACEMCGRKYAKQLDLDVHKRSKHTGERPFICKVCGKGFSGSTNLHLHMIVHSNEKNIVCELCGKCFKTKTGLNGHMIVHTGEKSFVCDDCGKAFFYKHTLQVHSLVHNTEKSFVCDLCGKSYKKKIDFIVHGRTHTGEKPYLCELCSKGFSSSRMLNQHRRRHGNDRPYVCSICNKGFKESGKLLNHKKLHTRENS